MRLAKRFFGKLAGTTGDLVKHIDDRIDMLTDGKWHNIVISEPPFAIFVDGEKQDLLTEEPFIDVGSDDG